MKVGNNGRRSEGGFKGRLSKDEINSRSKGCDTVDSYKEYEEHEFNRFYDKGKTTVEYDEEDIEKFDSTKYIDKKLEGESQKDFEARLKRAQRAKEDSRKERKYRERSNKLGLTPGKVFRMILTGLMGSTFLCIIVYGIYMNEIKYPSEMEVNIAATGGYALEEWEEALQDMEGGISDYLFTDSYLEEELKYSNGSDFKEKFFKRMVQSVKYTPKKVKVLNKYGNTLVDRDDNIVYRGSYVDFGESVSLSYVDYSSIQFNKEVLKKMMEERGLRLGVPGYSSKLTDLFCEYMLSVQELPIKTIDYVPNLCPLDGGDGFIVTTDEDIYLDKLLFSSKDFYKLLERFSLVAAEDSANPEWDLWNVKSDEEKAKEKEPQKVITSLEVTDTWKAWLNSKDKEETVEPNKYNPDYVIGKTWCGAYYLKHEYMELGADGSVIQRSVDAPLGDGSFENPASMGTEVLTVVRGNVKVDDEIVVKEYPIGIKMVEYGVSQDAIDWFESKDERNRGKDVKSEVQYVYYVFEIKNLSNKTIRIKDNSSLSDGNVNLSERTGIVYGLTDEVVLKPNETGKLESWSAAVNLNKKYIIWGKDFQREKDVVWFRKLAGDLEDTSEEKGVSINRSRYRDDTSSPDSN